MKTIRASSLNIAAHCPAAPYELKKPRRDDERTAAMQAGTDAHRWLELKYSGLQTPDDEEMAEFWDWWKDFNPVTPGCYRVEAALSKTYQDNVQLTGHIDLFSWGVDKPLRVIDWKYGAGQKYILPPLWQNWQMLAYAAMAYEYLGCNSERAEIFIVRISDREIDSHELTRADLAMADDAVHELLLTCEPDAHKTGPHCDHCLANGTCPAYLELAKPLQALVLAPSTAVSASQLIKWAISRGAVKRLTESMDFALKEYIREGGEIVHDGKRLRLSSYDVDKIVDHKRVIEAIGRRLDLLCGSGDGPTPFERMASEHLTISKAAGKKMLQGDFEKTWDVLKDEGAVLAETREVMKWGK